MMKARSKSAAIGDPMVAGVVYHHTFHKGLVCNSGLDASLVCNAFGSMKV
jgi:hypothetical protein